MVENNNQQFQKILFDLNERVYDLEQKTKQDSKQLEELALLKEKVNSLIFFQNLLEQQQKQEQQKENIEKNLTLAQKIRMYSFNTFDDYYNPNSEVMKTTVLGVRVCRTVKNRFFNFCEKEKLPARKVITYLIENFLDKYED